VFRTVDDLQAEFGLARDVILIVYRPIPKRLILIHRLMFDLNIFRFSAFESQKSNRRALFHLRFFQEQTFAKKKAQIWPDIAP
jgi:hypothetical protein